MASYIIHALLLAFIQIWIVPMAFNIKNFSWLTSNRDEAVDL